MKPQDIEIVQSVLEITGPIKPTEVYDKAKELFEKGEITNMFDCGGFGMGLVGLLSFGGYCMGLL